MGMIIGVTLTSAMGATLGVAVGVSPLAGALTLNGVAVSHPPTRSAPGFIPKCGQANL